MTKSASSKLVSFMAVVMITMSSLAQQTVATQTAYNPTAGSASFVTKLAPSPASSAIDAKSLALTRPKMIKFFSKNFPKAENQQWILADGLYNVSFTSEGKKSRAVFNNAGTYSYAISYINAEKLPAAIIRLIQSDYKGYQIFNVMEINTLNYTAHQIILENASGFLTLKISDDGLEESTVVFKKSSK